MNYLTQQLLNAEEINLIKQDLEDETQNWEDGKKTAGSHASLVKNNLQLNRNSEISKKYSQLVNKKILSNQLIKSFSLPKSIHGIIFTKSSKKMHDMGLGCARVPKIIPMQVQGVQGGHKVIMTWVWVVT